MKNLLMAHSLYLSYPPLTKGGIGEVIIQGEGKNERQIAEEVHRLMLRSIKTSEVVDSIVKRIKNAGVKVG